MPLTEFTELRVYRGGARVELRDVTGCSEAQIRCIEHALEQYHPDCEVQRLHGYRAQKPAPANRNERGLLE